MQDYARFHNNKTNLLLHIVMVPLFVVGVVYAPLAAMQGRWLAAALALLLPLFSIAVQGAGHKQEPNPPLPFDGRGGSRFWLSLSGAQEHPQPFSLSE